MLFNPTSSRKEGFIVEDLTALDFIRVLTTTIAGLGRESQILNPLQQKITDTNTAIHHDLKKKSKLYKPPKLHVETTSVLSNSKLHNTMTRKHSEEPEPRSPTLTRTSDLGGGGGLGFRSRA